MNFPPFQSKRRRREASSATSVRLTRRRLLVESLEQRLPLAAFVVNSVGDDEDSGLSPTFCDTRFNPEVDPPIPASGICTLRAAIDSSNETSEPDTISFNLSAGAEILTTGYTLGGRATIVAPAGKILITNSGTRDGSAGFVFGGTQGGSELRNFVINGFAEAVWLYSDNNTVAGNQIGVNLAGTSAVGNDRAVVVEGSGNVVGGQTDADRNIISGNETGVLIVDRISPISPKADNRVEGNYIGTDITGTQPIGNSIVGVRLSQFATASIVGGPGAAANVISSNRHGVIIESTATGNYVVGNLIGTDVTGATALGNVEGILINQSRDNFIGGVLPGSSEILGNVISGSIGDFPADVFGAGILIANAFSLGNVVQGNKLGTDITGTLAIPNAGDGVSINRAVGNVIGGTASGEGNLISGNAGDGVTIFGGEGSIAHDNVVIGNLIGTDVNGTAALPNGFRGVHIDVYSSFNIVGGTTAGERNVISGNDRDGVIIALDTATENRVIGNYIGVAADGSTRLGNEGNGVFIFRSPQNEIGGSGPGEGNTISANDQAGVRIQGAEARDNVVLANRIGTDYTALVIDPDGVPDNGDELGNSMAGVLIDHAPANRIGVPLDPSGVAAGNVIAGNEDGVYIGGVGSTGNLVGANLIGLDASGVQIAFGNRGAGVKLFGVSDEVIGGIATDGTTVPGNVVSRNDVGILVVNDGGSVATNNVIAGNSIGTDGQGMPRLTGTSLGNLTAGISIQDAAGNFIGQDTGADVPCDPENFAPGNIIAGNLGPGVLIEGENAQQNSVRCNSIFMNTEIGTDLGGDSVTLNDSLDLDANPNKQQNYPIISVFEHVEDNFRIAGTLSAEPSTSYRIDFYGTDISEAESIKQAIQGQRYLGTTVVTTDDSGYVQFTTDNFALLPIGDREVATATATDPQGNTSEFSNFTPDFTASGLEFRTPVIFVPGFFASFVPSKPGVVNDGNYLDFLTTLGIGPEFLVKDPLLKSYDDIIETLDSAGYELGEDLFVAAYDWRLPLGPADAFSTQDGVIDGVTAAQLTDNTYEYGLDYLGYWLKQAAEQWYRKYQVPLTNVHIIAHSMGGVLSRTYIQSTAYGDKFESTVRTDGGQLALPAVANLTMIGVPNRGAAVTFAPWDDNFAGDTSYQLVLSKMISHAWNKLKAGTPIDGGFNNTIDPADFDFNSSNLAAEKVRFVRAYVQGLANLLPEYDGFASNFDAELFPEFANWLLEDLNQTTRSTSRVARSIAIYGTSVETHTFVNQNSGPNFFLTPTLASFTDFRKHVPGLFQTWYSDTDVDNNGDGTVPLQSLEGLFIDDDRVELYPYCNGGCRNGDRRTSGKVNHTSIASNVDVQLQILRELGHPLDPVDIRHGSEIGQGSAVTDVVYPFLLVNLLVDPAGSLIVDQNGNRFGYTPETGALMEIPGSAYFGGADGIGWIYDNKLAGPLELRLSGPSEQHLVQVTTKFGDSTTGLEDSGSLADGETRILQIPKADVPPNGAAVVVAPDAGQAPLVQVFDFNGEALPSFLAFNSDFTGGVRVAVGDINGDGTQDIIAGSGAGMETRVRVFDGLDRSMLLDLAPFPQFQGGVFVAAGDVSGDGYDDIIASAGAGGPPRVKVFDGLTGSELQSFLAYNTNFTGGVFVAAGDVDGDGRDDIITGAGQGSGPHVKVFDGISLVELQSFFAYDGNFTGGVRVAAGDVNGDGAADIITGTGPGGGPHVKIFNGLDVAEIDSFFAYDTAYQGGVFVGSVMLANDGVSDIVVSPGADHEPQVKLFDGATREERNRALVFDAEFSSGLFVAGSGTSRAVIVELPPDGARYTAITEGNDFVVRLDNGDELSRTHLEPGRRFRIDGAHGVDDALVINLDGLTVPIIFDGGQGGNDSLVIEGSGERSFIEYAFTNSSDGTIRDASHSLISFRGLEPISDNLNVVDRRFIFPDTDDDITLDTGPDANDDKLRVDSNNSELVDFREPTGSLALITGDGTDALTIRIASIFQRETTLRVLRVDQDTSDTVNYGTGWSVDIPRVFSNRYLHVLTQDEIELHLANTVPFQNPLRSLDTNRDGSVSPIDALIIVNRLNTSGAGLLPTPTSLAGVAEFFYIDTNGDLSVSPIDVLQVVNFLNSFLGSGEAESATVYPRFDGREAVRSVSSGAVTSRVAKELVSAAIAPSPLGSSIIAVAPPTSGRDCRPPDRIREEDLQIAIDAFFNGFDGNRAGALLTQSR